MTDTKTTEAGWQLEDDAANAYQSYLVPAIFEPMSHRLVSAAGVESAQRVLDVACGTGVVSRAAARAVGRGGTTTGIDLNADMLAAAARASDDPIEFRLGDVGDLPFEDGSFDVALCQEAVQFFPDRVAALREMRRVTRPGGRVAFSVFRSLDHHPVYATFAAALGEHAGPEAEAMMESPFALGDPEVLRSAALEAGLEHVEVRISVGAERFPSVVDFVHQEAASSPLAGPLGALDPDRRTALIRDLETKLAPHLDDAGLAFPNETHIVTADR